MTTAKHIPIGSITCGNDLPLTRDRRTLPAGKRWITR